MSKKSGANSIRATKGATQSAWTTPTGDGRDTAANDYAAGTISYHHLLKVIKAYRGF